MCGKHSIINLNTQSLILGMQNIFFMTNYYTWKMEKCLSIYIT